MIFFFCVKHKSLISVTNIEVAFVFHGKRVQKYKEK
jgi:hypothetical protein